MSGLSAKVAACTFLRPERLQRDPKVPGGASDFVSSLYTVTVVIQAILQVMNRVFQEFGGPSEAEEIQASRCFASYAGLQCIARQKSEVAILTKSLHLTSIMKGHLDLACIGFSRGCV